MNDNDRNESGRPARSGASEAPDQPDTWADVDPDVAQLLGVRPAEAYAIPTADELEARAPAGDQPDEDAATNLEAIVAVVFRDGETDDAREAAEEGLAWVPPTDEVEARVLDALRADAQTVGLVDGLQVDAEGSRITIAGAVDDLADDGVTEADIRVLAGTQPAPTGPKRGGTPR